MIYEPYVITGDPAKLLIDPTARVDSFCKFEAGLGISIGPYVHIASYCHVGIGGGRVTIEEGAGLGSGAKVISGSAQPEGLSMSAAMPEGVIVLKSHTIIGRNATLAVNSVVMPGLRIGEGAILAAGAVATKDIPPFEIWAGVPARKIAERHLDTGG